MVTIFQVATSFLIFSTTIPSLAQYRKQMKSNYIFTYANWKINLIIGFHNHAWLSVEPVTYLMCSSFHFSLYNSFALIWNKNSFMFSLVFLSFRTSVNTFLKFLATISFIIFWDFSMFYQIFLSPQVKWWAIITYKEYELPHELPNDLRLRILGN